MKTVILKSRACGISASSFKPVVYYQPEDAQIRGIGCSAFMWVVYHPNHRPGRYFSTSRVISVEPDGSFETLNTRYVPLPRAPSPEVAERVVRVYQFATVHVPAVVMLSIFEYSDITLCCLSNSITTRNPECVG